MALRSYEIFSDSNSFSLYLYTENYYIIFAISVLYCKETLYEKASKAFFSQAKNITLDTLTSKNTNFFFARV